MEGETKMAGTDLVDKKIRIQGHGIRISEELKQRIRREGYYPIALTWIGEDITGPFSFAGYGDRSPFELRFADGGYHVFENGKHFTEVSFYRKPDFFERQWVLDKNSDNRDTVFIDEGMAGVVTACAGVVTPCGGQEGPKDEQGDLLNVTGGRFPYVILACYNGLTVWPSWGCLYTRQQKPCRFCCIPGDFQENRVLINQDSWLENLAATVEAAVHELGDDIRNCSFTVDAGTIPGRDKGAKAYIRVLDAIRKRLGKLPETYYTRAVIEPPEDDEWLYALRDAGFTDIQMDVDVYDNEERRKIMPNAKGNRPIEAYEQAFLKAKQIFPGEVATQLVAGIQKDENLLAGVERFAAIGIPTLVTPFLPFGQGAKLAREEGIEVPNADKMWRLYEASANHLVKNGVPAPQFRGGVSSLPEVMGRRHKRAAALTNTVRRSSVVAPHRTAEAAATP